MLTDEFRSYNQEHITKICTVPRQTHKHLLSLEIIIYHYHNIKHNSNTNKEDVLTIRKEISQVVLVNTYRKEIFGKLSFLDLHHISYALKVFHI